MPALLKNGRLRLALLALYFAVVAGLFLYFNMRLTLDWVALILFVAAILSGRGLLFLRDWGVFFVVLVAWQMSSGLANEFSFPWHLRGLILADKAMFFGTVPAAWLQQHLYHPGVMEPWDVLAATMYMLHFLAPLVCGFILWLSNREMFQKFALTFVLVAVAGFATYIVYPAVPPWMAAEPMLRVGHEYVRSPHGQVYLPGVKNLFNVIAGNWYNPYHGNIRLGLLQGHYDNVGAMPSEHSAYPMLFFLFLRKQFGRPGYLALVYIALLLFSIMYLGQHYFIDAVVGFGYAIIGYLIVMHLVPWVRRWFTARQGVGSFPPLAGATELEEA